MDKRPELYQIEEPEPAVKREVLHIRGIRSARPATPHPVGRPWPRHIAWREYLRRAKSQEQDERVKQQQERHDDVH